MNKALTHMLETLDCDLSLDDHSLAEVLREKTRKRGHARPSPDGLD